MAIRKPLFMSTEGYAQETDPTADEIDVGKIVLAGIGGISADFGGARATNAATPTTSTDLATKGYVDSLASGTSWKSPARAATTGALPANTYANGASGVGATLTATSNAALTSQDGIALNVADRLLVKNEATAANNGLYAVTQLGSVSLPYILTRVTDCDQSTEFLGAAVFVEEGTTNADTAYTQTTDGTITVGTTAITWTQFASVATLTASTGLIRSGNDFRVKPGDGIEVVSNSASTNVALDATAPGIQFTGSAGSGKLKFKPDTSRGLNVDATGAFVILSATTPGVQFAGDGGLQLKMDSAGGLQLGSSGNAIKTDTTENSVSTTSSGLKVLRSPKISTLQVASGAIAKGDSVYINGNNLVSTGTSSSDANARMIGMASAAIGNGSTGEIVTAGIVTGVLTGATANTPFYLDTTGQPTSTAPIAGSNKRVICLGYAINTTDLFLEIKDYGKRI